MHRFLVVIEKINDNYSAYSPDLPGCVAAGDSLEDTEHSMHEAIEMHVRGLREDDEPIPAPHAVAEYVAIELDSA